MPKPALIKYNPKATTLTTHHGFHIETSNHIFQFPAVGPETSHHGFTFNLENAAKKVSVNLDSDGNLILRFDEE
jgi:hypothetical protein